MDKKFLDYEGVSFYDDLIKEHVAEEVELTHLNDATIPDVQQLDEPYENNIDALADDVANKVATAFMSITAETVTVVVRTEIPGLSVANLILNVIYNDNPTKIAQQPITDGNGMCSFRVPNGYTYKIIFPDRPNCHEIIPVQHTAAILQRSVEVEYVAKTQQEIEDEKGETVRVNLNDHLHTSVSNPSSDINVTLNIGGTINIIRTTDDYGIAEFQIDPQYYGQTYTVTVPQRENYYIRNNVYSKSFVAEKTTREIHFNYRQFNTGVFVVTSDGKEYDYNQWVAAITADENPVDKSTAVFIKVATSILLGQEAQFGIKIDHIRKRTDGVTTGRQWCNQDIAFSPDLDYVSTAPYYYNGKAATQAIIEEAESKSATLGATVTVPAATYCWNMTYTLQDEDNTVCQGFLGTVYQWSVLWGNRFLIDDLLDKILPLDEKPDGVTYYTLQGLSSSRKRTSNQVASDKIWTPIWTGNSYSVSGGYVNKTNNTIWTIPFFSV